MRSEPPTLGRSYETVPGGGFGLGGGGAGWGCGWGWGCGACGCGCGGGGCGCCGCGCGCGCCDCGYGRGCGCGRGACGCGAGACDPDADCCDSGTDGCDPGAEDADDPEDEATVSGGDALMLGSFPPQETITTARGATATRRDARAHTSISTPFDRGDPWRRGARAVRGYLTWLRAVGVGRQSISSARSLRTVPTTAVSRRSGARRARPSARHRAQRWVAERPRRSPAGSTSDDGRATPTAPYLAARLVRARSSARGA
jgi:hypothetical protein